MTPADEARPIDIAAAHADLARRFPKTLEALRQSEREDEARLATFFARPEWCEVRALVEQIAPDGVRAIDAIVQRVRVNVWKDFSSSRDHAPTMADIHRDQLARSSINGQRHQPKPKCWMNFPDCSGACGSYGCENR